MKTHNQASVLTTVSHCYNEMPEQKQPAEGRIYLGSQYKDSIHPGEEAWQQKGVSEPPQP